MKVFLKINDGEEINLSNPQLNVISTTDTISMNTDTIYIKPLVDEFLNILEEN